MKTTLLPFATVVLVVSTAQWAESADRLPVSSRRIQTASASWNATSRLGGGEPAVQTYQGAEYGVDGWYQGHIGFAPNDCCGRCSNAWDGYCAEKEQCGKWGGKLHGRCGKCGDECGGRCGHLGKHCGHCGPLSGLGRWSPLSAPDGCCGHGCTLRHKLGFGHHRRCCEQGHAGCGGCCNGSATLADGGDESSAPVPPEPPQLETPAADDSDLL